MFSSFAAGLSFVSAGAGLTLSSDFAFALPSFFFSGATLTAVVSSVVTVVSLSETVVCSVTTASLESSEF